MLISGWIEVPFLLPLRFFSAKINYAEKPIVGTGQYVTKSGKRDIKWDMVLLT